MRVDSALRPGLVVSADYDPMLAKLIAWGPDRDEALARLRGALARTAVLGSATNVTFLTRLLDEEDVRAGRLDTGLIERRLDVLTAPARIPDGPLAAALVLLADERRHAPAGPWGATSGFRLGGRAPALVELADPGVRIVVDGPLEDAVGWRSTARPRCRRRSGSRGRRRSCGSARRHACCAGRGGARRCT